KILISEVITRSAKHVFKTYLQGVELSGLSAAISHFLNCFLSSFPNSVAHLPADELVSKKKNKKRKNRNLGSADNTAWASVTPQELWKNICSEAKAYFDYNVECENVDQAVEVYNLQKISLLREICNKVGIQILLKEYNFENRHKPTFTEEDILNIFPVVKHVNPKASDAFHFFQSGQAKVQQGFLKEGCELINEALNLFNNVYGAMHVEICACLRLLARLNYIMGDYTEDSSRNSSSFTQGSATSGYGTLGYHQQEISGEVKPEVLHDQACHESEEDEGICGCDKVPRPSCHSEKSAESSHASSVFHSDLLVGIANEQIPPPSLLACATPALNFAAQQLEKTGTAADSPLNFTQMHSGNVEEQSTSDGFFASLDSSTYCKELQLATQCPKSSLDRKGLICTVVKGINPIVTLVLDSKTENPHEKLCGVCKKNSGV
ncbi:clustered mitochondria protein homolog, partial [Pyxicephalus adspersus]|uniref:clustered mitochondria protein homolog n=1 Tax=Pyxicephalus adspersus TaxID=30357 RepID=UPI003B5B2A2A